MKYSARAKAIAICNVWRIHYATKLGMSIDDDEPKYMQDYYKDNIAEMQHVLNVLEGKDGFD